MAISVVQLAKMIDHSLLHPTMTDEQMTQECLVAKEFNCASVCIKPYAIPLAVKILAGSDVRVGTVVGFPHGSSTIEVKIEESIQACKAGAVEIDIVVNVGKVVGGDWDYVSREIKGINDAVLAKGGIVKVIFETDFLVDSDIVRLCQVCSDHSVAFVKTSTGFGFVKQENGMYSYNGATARHLSLMRTHSAAHVQVKASGGVRTLEALLKARTLGVTRVGATATKAILTRAAQLVDQGQDLDRLDIADKELGGGY